MDKGKLVAVMEDIATPKIFMRIHRAALASGSEGPEADLRRVRETLPRERALNMLTWAQQHGDRFQMAPKLRDMQSGAINRTFEALEKLYHESHPAPGLISEDS